jgi:hypothetical protein
MTSGFGSGSALTRNCVLPNTRAHVDKSRRVAKAFGRARSLQTITSARLGQFAGDPMGAEGYHRDVLPAAEKKTIDLEGRIVAVQRTPILETLRTFAGIWSR